MPNICSVVACRSGYKSRNEELIENVKHAPNYLPFQARITMNVDTIYQPTRLDAT